MVALKTYNSLPKELKSLYSNKNNRKCTLKNKLKFISNLHYIYVITTASFLRYWKLMCQIFNIQLLSF